MCSAYYLLPRVMVVQEFLGFNTRPWAWCVYLVACVFSCGWLWVLRHYIPQTRLWMMYRCPLSKAQYVQAKLVNGRQELLKVQDLPTLHHSHQDSTRSQSSSQKSIQLLMIVYIYEPAADTFVEIPDMPAEIPLQIRTAIQALQAIETGGEWTEFNPAAIWSRKERAQLYGYNDIAVGRPNLLRMTAHLMSYPLYTVQYLELAFEIYTGWYCYAAVLYFISVVSCFLGVRALYVKRLELFKTIQQQHIMPVVSKGRVRQVHTALCSIQCFATCMQPQRRHLPT